jgi:hypothetical protein
MYSSSELYLCFDLSVEYRSKNANIYRYVPTTFYTEFDVNSEIEREEQNNRDSSVSNEEGHTGNTMPTILSIVEILSFGVDLFFEKDRHVQVVYVHSLERNSLDEVASVS